MSARRVGVAGLLAAALVVAVAGLGASNAGADPGPRRDTVATVVPCPNGRPVAPNVACTGPAVHHSGGGAGIIAIIAISVVVGVGVAAGAFVVVRRRIALDAATPRLTRPRRPS